MTRSTPDPARTIFILAGEPSGDRIGAAIMAALRARHGALHFIGVGGPEMMEQGLSPLFAMEDLSVFGLVEVLPRLARLRRRLDEVAAKIRAAHPDLVLTIDSKGFSFALARRLAVAPDHPPLAHVVAPTVWAYRPGRARKIAAFLDHLLVLFPFEAAYFTGHGLATTFIGHPAADRPPGDGARFRRRHDLPADAPLLGLLPGSRAGEVSRLLPVFLAAAARLRERAPDLRIVLPTVPAVAAKVRAVVDGGATPVTVVEGVADQNDLFAALHLALAASGTATLELALAEVPTVVAYKVHPLTAFIGRRVVDMSTVVLTNRILGRPVQPFFVQENCRPEDLVTALAALLPAGAARDAQIAAGGELRAALRPDDRAAAARAADCLMALMRP